MNILITRPSISGKQLVSKLCAIGKSAWYFPLIKFSEGSELLLLVHRLQTLSKGDLVFVLSKHSIYYIHLKLLKIGMSWPKKIKYYAIGRNSGFLLYKLSNLPVLYPRIQETSEALLCLPTLMHIKGRTALILRGNGGRNILEKTLHKRGAKVECFQCYSRQLIYYNGHEQINRMLILGINILVITSGIMLQQFYNLTPIYYRSSWLIRCKIVVVSKRLALLARQLGWTDIIISNTASNENLINSIIKIY